MSLLSVVSQATTQDMELYRVSEQDALAADSTEFVMRLLKIYSKRLEYSVAHVAAIQDRLLAETAFAMKRLHKDLKENVKRVSVQMADEEGDRSELTQQSLSGDTKTLETLFAYWTESLTALRETPEIKINGKIIYPAAFVNRRMRIAFRNWIHGFAVDVKQNLPDTPVRPSIALNRLQQIINAMMMVDRHINMGFPDIISEIMMEEFSNPTFGNAGGPRMSKVVKIPELSLTNVYARWWIKTLNRLGGQQMCYSPRVNGFVSYNAKDAHEFRAEKYMDIREFEAFGRLVGPAGVRVADRIILQSVRKQAENIFSKLKGSTNILKTLRKDAVANESWYKTMRKVKHLDSFFESMIALGQLIRLRKLMLAGLNISLKKHNQLLVDTIQHVQNVCKPEGGLDASEALAVLALDAGIQQMTLTGASDRSDPALAMSVTKFTAKEKEEEAVWRCLPEMVGLCVASSKWRGARYLVKYGALSNDGYLMCDALLAITHSVFPDEATEFSKRFLFTAALGLSHIGSGQSPANSLVKDINVEAVSTTIEYFMGLVPEISWNYLESVYPFQLIRESFVHLMQKK
eukprot:92674_1